MYPVTIMMAWRNLWRNTRRTLITSLAIALGLTAIILSVAWMDGLMNHLLKAMIGGSMGQAQIHAPGYRQTREEELTIPRADQVLKRVEAAPGLTGAAPRLYAQGLAAMGDRSAGVEVLGVDFAREARVTDWKKKIVAGSYPLSSPGSGSGDGKAVLIGKGLAGKLELEAGARLVLTVARADSGDLEGALAPVAGIINTGIPLLDDHAVIGPLELVGKITGQAGKVHEIALRFDTPGRDRAELERLIAPLRTPDLDVQPWPVLAPMISGMMDLQAFYLALATAIIFGLAAFGIVNTMSMSLLERFKEFGVLRAIGTSPGRLLGLILAEAASLGAVGAALGGGLGVGLTLIFRETGIPLGGMEAMGVNIDSTIYPGP